MASITKRGDSYLIRCSDGYSPNGRQKYKTATFKPAPGLTPKQKEKAANEFAVLFERKVKEGRVLDGNIRFADFAEKWMTEYSSKHNADKTNLFYKQALKRMNPYIGNIKLENIQPHHLLSFYNSISGAGGNMRTGGVLSPKTILHYHRLISSILSTAVKWGVIFSNCAERTQAPKIERKEAKSFTKEQIAKIFELLECEDIKYKTAIIMLVYTGARRGELIALKWGDIDLNKEILSIQRSAQYTKEGGVKEKPPKTNSSYRTIKLPSQAIGLLKEYRRHQKEERLKVGDRWIDGDYLFTKWNGEMMFPDSLTNFFSKFLKKHGFPKGLSIHSLRHTNASLQIESGVNVRNISRWLGHADTTTTLNIYSHAFDAQDALTAQTLDGLFDIRSGS